MADIHFGGIVVSAGLGNPAGLSFRAKNKVLSVGIRFSVFGKND